MYRNDRISIGNVCGNCQQQVSLDCEFNGVQGSIHELGHALRLQHEHKHPERTFILIPDPLQDGTANKYKKLDPNDFDLGFEHGIGVPNGDGSQYCEGCPYVESILSKYNGV